MSSCDQLQALMKKNFILMKRNCCATLCEMFFPIVLMLLLAVTKSLFKITDSELTATDEAFIKSNSSAFPSLNNLSALMQSGNMSSQSFYGIPIRSGQFMRICRGGGGPNSVPRTTIGLVGNIPNKIILSNYFNLLNLTTKNFASIDELNSYTSSPNWGTSNFPPLCFAITLQQFDINTFNYTLHYFDMQDIQEGMKDIPGQRKSSLSTFQYGPDLSSYTKYHSSGFLEMMSIINNMILQITTGNNNIQLNTAVGAQKFYSYKNDPFARAIGFILPFFLVIAYVCPLCIVVFRIVSDKESRAKEGMKIMGLTEGVYFLSYFLNYLIMNTIYAILNSFILLRVLTQIPYGYIFLFFWLYGLSVFSMAYLFQSFVDRTRIAVILSLIIYFIMYFISQAFFSDDITNSSKMGISLLPPASLSLGLQVISQFEGAFLKFDSSYMSYPFQNYTVGNMYGMLVVDIFLYLFLGFYLQNVVHSQYGTSKPFYFLCTKSYWCKSKNSEKQLLLEKAIEMKQKKESSVIPMNDEDPENFQDERNYEEHLNSGDCLEIKNIVKIYDDGKQALNGLSLNMYNNEIFALLGHNGAGKSTLISILCGLYEATEGNANYHGTNILENMDEFRKSLGICPQHDVLFDKLTQREHLEMFAVYKGIPSDQRETEVEKIIEEMGIKEKENDLVEGLSGGQKRKLSIAIALLGGSKVVFLDEPSSGMDITSRRKLWDILKRSSSNKIIVLTTHFMEEASVLGNRIGIVSSGKLKCCGTSLFLIERFGKTISLTIAKGKNADDDKIIKFVSERIKSLEYEILSEEILIKIPKNEQINLKEFFADLDANLEDLNIKSYGASMPTLEDVFLNVSEDKHSIFILNKEMKTSEKKNKTEEKKGEINGFSYDMYKREDGEVTGFNKFCVDLNASLYKRLIQLIRDYKTLILEVVCPILLVLIGLIIANIEFIKDSPPKEFSLNLLPTPQTTYYINSPIYANNLSPGNVFQNSSIQLFSSYDNSQKVFNNNFDVFIDYVNYLYQKASTNQLAGYSIINADKTKNIYDSVIFVNTIAQDGAPIFYQDHLSKMINAIAGKQVNISANVYSLPITYQIKTRSKIRNSSNLVFFVSIAFALIPANFITIIIREKEANTKHLQIVSGISLLAYWISNFIFELIKYFTTGAICLGMMAAYGQIIKEMWIIYFLYGISMIPFTYCFSFIFKLEATAQNFIILKNFLFGALGGSIIFILRINDSTLTYAKGAAAIFRIIPAFALSYGFIESLSSTALAYIDYGTNVSIDILSSDYVGSDIIYMVIISVLSLITICLCEVFKTKFSFTDPVNSPPDYDILDTDVKEEIAMINEEKVDKSEFAIQVKNLEKNYSTPCFGPDLKNSVDKLSFHLNKGECFALLGLNGAGKTSTFKCLTCEIFPTKGEIFVNGMELTQNFENVRNMIGYCPQFDAIFDYMTVYENLYFYSCVKGIPYDKRDLIAVSLMKEMNLHQFADKQSGNLSGGNKRKLSVAIALIGNPQIVLLDEPSTGVDPEARRFMWSVIHKISVTLKQSSVILTTHSMEEAETLCRRMGIMVKGQFRCLGTAQSIKNKYGAVIKGFEIDLRINTLSEEGFAEMLEKTERNKDEQIEDKELTNLFTKLNKKKYVALLQKKIGFEIHEEFETKKFCSIRRLFNWLFFTENILKLCSKLSFYYQEIVIAEFYDCNFKLKVQKPTANNTKNTIGFLFGLFEDYKTQYEVTEYGISQASLEQIFNRFAREVEEKNESSNSQSFKSKIEVTEELLKIVDISE